MKKAKGSARTAAKKKFAPYRKGFMKAYRRYADYYYTRLAAVRIYRHQMKRYKAKRR